MSRRNKAVERPLVADSKYSNLKVAKFINCIMKQGKKSVAESIVYKSFDIIKEKLSEDPVIVFEQALANVEPKIKVISKRMGGSNLQVPMEVNKKNAQALAFRWIIGFARKRSEKSMGKALAAELMAAYKNEGSTIKKKEETHKMAEANRAFAHMKW